MTLDVIYAPAALKELDEIWDWNEQAYGRDHAAGYVEFLQSAIDALGKDHAQGRGIAHFPELHYVLIRRRTKGHGHLAVYSVDGSQVNILHIFHTAQDWQDRLARDSRESG